MPRFQKLTVANIETSTLDAHKERELITFFLNLKHVNSNNPKVKVTCCNIINQHTTSFP